MTPKKYIVPVFVPHLGCPNDCVFCNQRRISGHTAPATADTVKEEIEKALRYIPEGADTELAFYGGSFTAIDEEQQIALLSAAAPYISDNKIKSIRLSTRPDCIDSRTVERLLLYNVKTVELGVQSMCDDVLEASNRGHTALDAKKASKLIKEAGLELILQMMTGLPGDTREKSLHTAKKLADMGPDGVRIYPTVIIKDTRLYDMWRDGSYAEHTVDEAADLCCDILEIFEKADIPVIRLGLNPTDELSGSAAVGGAYHPAFGQIVYGRRYLKRAAELIKETYPDGDVPDELSFIVPRGDISTFVGQKRCNIKALCEMFGIKEIKVSESDEKCPVSGGLALKNNLI